MDALCICFHFHLPQKYALLNPVGYTFSQSKSYLRRCLRVSLNEDGLLSTCKHPGQKVAYQERSS